MNINKDYLLSGRTFHYTGHFMNMTLHPMALDGDKMQVRVTNDTDKWNFDCFLIVDEAFGLYHPFFGKIEIRYSECMASLTKEQFLSGEVFTYHGDIPKLQKSDLYFHGLSSSLNDNTHKLTYGTNVHDDHTTVFGKHGHVALYYNECRLKEPVKTNV